MIDTQELRELLLQDVSIINIGTYKDEVRYRDLIGYLKSYTDNCTLIRDTDISYLEELIQIIDSNRSKHIFLMFPISNLMTSEKADTSDLYNGKLRQSLYRTIFIKIRNNNQNLIILNIFYQTGMSMFNIPTPLSYGASNILNIQGKELVSTKCRYRDNFEVDLSNFNRSLKIRKILKYEKNSLA